VNTNTITLTDEALVVEPVGLDQLWSFRRRLEVPWEHVRGATHDPGFIHEPKGIRGPGLRLGQKLCGTFHAEGDKQFWNVSGAEDIVVVELADEPYDRLVLSADRPFETVDEINANCRG
jgi:hypothetical protein